VTAATAKPIAATTATTETAGTGFPRASFVYCQRPSTQLCTVQSGHCFIRIGVNGHFDKRETPSLPSVPVFHDLYSIYLTICGKSRIQILLCRLERNVPDINILQGVLLICCRCSRFVFMRELNSAGRLIKAGKVAVGGLEQPRFYSSAPGGGNAESYCSVADLCASSPIIGRTYASS
jgi:hypothetical protein